MTQIPQPMPGQAERTPPNPVHEFLWVVRRHKWKEMFVFLLVMAATSVVTLKMANVYRAEAKIEIKPGLKLLRESSLKEMGEVASLSLRLEQEINPELTRLQSRNLAVKVVERITLERLLPEEEPAEPAEPDRVGSIWEKAKQAIKELLGGTAQMHFKVPREELAVQVVQGNLKVKSQKESTVIDLSYESQNPVLAAEVLNVLIEEYQVAYKDFHLKRSVSRLSETKAKEYKESLEAKENELQEFKSTQAFAFLGETRRSLIGRISTLNADLAKAVVDKEAVQARVEALERQIKETLEMVVTSKVTGGSGWNAAERMREMLFALELEEKKITAKYADDSEMVKEIREQIANARPILKDVEPREQVTEGKNPTWQRIEQELVTNRAELSALTAQEKAIEKTTGELETKLEELDKNFNTVEFEIAKKTREIEFLTGNYQRWQGYWQQESYTEEASKAERGSDDVNLVQTPVTPMTPARPNRRLNLMVGFLLAIFGAIGLAYFFEFMDQTFRRPEEVEAKLGIPVLVAIPRVRGKTLPKVKWVSKGRTE